MLCTIIFKKFIRRKLSHQLLQKGYFIDNATNKIECFIRNPEKFNTPENFVYKINENDTEVKTKTINDSAIASVMAPWPKED